MASYRRYQNHEPSPETLTLRFQSHHPLDSAVVNLSVVPAITMLSQCQVALCASLGSDPSRGVSNCRLLFDHFCRTLRLAEVLTHLVIFLQMRHATHHPGGWSNRYRSNLRGVKFRYETRRDLRNWSDSLYKPRGRMNAGNYRKLVSERQGSSKACAIRLGQIRL